MMFVPQRDCRGHISQNSPCLSVVRDCTVSKGPFKTLKVKTSQLLSVKDGVGSKYRNLNFSQRPVRHLACQWKLWQSQLIWARRIGKISKLTHVKALAITAIITTIIKLLPMHKILKILQIISIQMGPYLIR